MKNKRIFILVIAIISLFMVNSEKALADGIVEGMETSNETVSADEVSEEDESLSVKNNDDIDFLGDSSETYFSKNDIKTISGRSFETPADVYFADWFWGTREDIPEISINAQYQIVSINDITVKDSEKDGYTDMEFEANINIYASFSDNRKKTSNLNFGVATTELGLVDKYTGTMVASKWLSGDDSYSNNSEIDIDGKNYDIYYEKETVWSEGDISYLGSRLEGYSRGVKVKYKISYPNEYDGLMFYIEKSGRYIGQKVAPNWDDKLLLDTFSKDDLYVININSEGNEADEKTYTVTYFENGAESGDVPCEKMTYYPTSAVTVFGNVGKLNKTGYKFIGWSTNSSGTEAEYKEGDIFVINKDVSLYAIWKRAFSQGVDNNNFIHNNKQPNEGFYNINNYKLTKDYKDKLLSYCIDKGEESRINNIINSKWNGSCCGIASTMGLLYDGYLNEKDLSDTAVIGAGYYSLPEPKNDKRMSTVIDYYQLAQNLKILKTYEIIYSPTFGVNTTKQKDWLEGLMKSVKKYNTVELSVWYKKSDSKIGAHATLITDYEYDSTNKRYILKLYDENYFDEKSYFNMYINEDFSDFSIDKYNKILGIEYLDWNIYEQFGVNDIQSLVIEDDVSTNDIGSNNVGLNYSEIASDAKDVLTLVIDPQKNFEIENEKGEKLTYNKESFSGNLAVKNSCFTAFSEEKVEVSIEVDNTDYIKLKPLNGKGVGFGLYSNNDYMYVSASGVSSVIYNVDSSIVLDGQNIDFDVAISNNGKSSYMEKITGKSTKGISFVNGAEGIEINVVDKATDVTRKIIDGDKVSVNEVGNIEICDFVIKNPDGSYTMNLATKQKVVVEELGKSNAGSNKYIISYNNTTSKKCATITSKGIIKAKKVGKSDITVQKNGKSIKVTVNVYDPKFKFASSKKQYSVNVGEKIKPEYDNCKLKTVFSIPAKQQKYATVDSRSGEITAISKGKVIITASVGEGKNARKVSARVKIYNPTLMAKDTVGVGKSIKLKVKDGEKKTSWSIVKGNEFATIDTKGKLTGVAMGTVTVQAVNNGKTMTKEIKIQ